MASIWYGVLLTPGQQGISSSFKGCAVDTTNHYITNCPLISLIRAQFVFWRVRYPFRCGSVETQMRR